MGKQKFYNLLPNSGKKNTFLPDGYHHVELSPEQRRQFEKLALEIFTVAANRGVSFSEALVSVYISGVEHGVRASEEIK